MKKALSASVLLNLVLMACLFALLKQPASNVPKTEAPVQAEIASNEVGASTSTEAEPVREQPVCQQLSAAVGVVTLLYALEYKVKLRSRVMWFGFW